uniref:hypothetical protein n=1 Tax=Mammaliicoccus sciuri TaxID=1296 RepID=UPI001301EBB9
YKDTNAYGKITDIDHIWQYGQEDRHDQTFTIDGVDNHYQLNYDEEFTIEFSLKQNKQWTYGVHFKCIYYTSGVD